MRARLASRIEPASDGAIEYLRLGWTQAGFLSFAYRLAHFGLPRSALIGGLSLVFFLG